MNPMFSSIVSVVFVMVGITAVLIMLNLQGNPIERSSNKLLRQLHRILGYLFILIFFIMIIGMIIKVKGINYEFSPRITIHVVLALILIPILIVKILIARFFKRLYPNLVLIGLLIFFLSFAMVGITAGYIFLQSPDKPETLKEVVSEPGKKVKQERGGDILKKKCTICHTLERVNKAKKNETQWKATVDKMIEYIKNPDHLTEEEKTILINYLSRRGK